jgi:nascent polypeptide-associated complex subunit alpha
MQKLGMIPVTGVARVALKKSKNMIFVISQPDVYKSPNSDTYIIFGEAKVEDLSKTDFGKAAEQFRAPEAAVKAPTVIPTPSVSNNKSSAIVEDTGDVDETGLDPKDIDLVISQAQCTRPQAVKALKNNENDIVNAIMELTM